MTRVPYVTTGDVRRMREMRAGGALNIEIKAATGRTLNTIARHLGPRPRTTAHPLDKMARRAERIERLYAACNRAIGEVRA